MSCFSLRGSIGLRNIANFDRRDGSRPSPDLGHQASTRHHACNLNQIPPFISNNRPSPLPNSQYYIALARNWKQPATTRLNAPDKTSVFLIFVGQHLDIRLRRATFRCCTRPYKPTLRINRCMRRQPRLSFSRRSFKLPPHSFLATMVKQFPSNV